MVMNRIPWILAQPVMEQAFIQANSKMKSRPQNENDLANDRHLLYGDGVDIWLRGPGDIIDALE